MTASKETLFTARKFKSQTFEHSEVAGVELIKVPPSVIQWRLFDCSKCRKNVSDASAKLAKYEISFDERNVFKTRDAYELVDYKDDDPAVYTDTTVTIDSKYIQIHNAILYTHFMMATPANRARRYGFKNIPQIGQMMRLYFFRCVDPDLDFVTIRTYCFTRILASWIDMLDVTVASQDNGVFLLKTMLNPFESGDLKQFEIYAKLHLLLHKLYIGFGNTTASYENVLRRSNVGLDIMRAFIHLKESVYLHRRFIMECLVYFRDSTMAVLSYHHEFVQLINDLDYKVPNDNSEILFISSEPTELEYNSQATRLKVLFHEFACDKRVCPKVITALTMCIGTPCTTDEGWTDRIAMMNACDTAYTRHCKSKQDLELAAYLAPHAIRYPPPPAALVQVAPFSTLKFESLRMLGKPRKPAGYKPSIETAFSFCKSTVQSEEAGLSGMKFLPKVDQETYMMLYHTIKFIDHSTTVTLHSFDIERQMIETPDIHLPIYQNGTDLKVFHFEQTLFHKI